MRELGKDFTRHTSFSPRGIDGNISDALSPNGYAKRRALNASDRFAVSFVPDNNTTPY